MLGLERGELRVDTPYRLFRALRNVQSRYVFPALGLLNLGWLLVGVGLMTGPAERRRAHRNLAQVLGIALLCLTIWILTFLSEPIVQHASYATLQLLFAGLAGAEDGKRKVFRDSAIENLTEFFDRFRHLSLSSDSQLDELVDQAQRVVRGIGPQQLRDDQTLRQHVATELSAVQSVLDGLLVDRPRRNILRRPR